MNLNTCHCDNQKQHFSKISEKQSITISYNDLNQFIKEFTNLGVELTVFRSALFAHQTKVRQVLLDSRGDNTQ